MDSNSIENRDPKLKLHKEQREEKILLNKFNSIGDKIRIRKLRHFSILEIEKLTEKRSYHNTFAISFFIYAK